MFGRMFNSRVELQRRCHSVWGVQEGMSRWYCTSTLSVLLLRDTCQCTLSVFAWRPLESKRIAQSAARLYQTLEILESVESNDEFLMQIVCLTAGAIPAPVRERAVSGRPVCLVPEGRKSEGFGRSRRHTHSRLALSRDMGHPSRAHARRRAINEMKEHERVGDEWRPMWGCGPGLGGICSVPTIIDSSGFYFYRTTIHRTKDRVDIS